MRLEELTEPANRKEIEAALDPFINFINSGDPKTRKDIAKMLQNTLEQFGVAEVGIQTSKNVEPGDMNMNAA